MKKAFTIIELLVVITIIVVLLALLTPALDKAIEAAEMAMCGTQQHGVLAGANSYAFSNKRRYPYRPAANDPEIGFLRPSTLTVPPNGDQTSNLNGYDDRPTYSDYFSINSLQCPPAGEVDLATPDASVVHVRGSFNLFFGWKYKNGGRRLEKVGDKVSWLGKQYDVMVSDILTRNLFGGGLMYASHPDKKGGLGQESKDQEDWAEFDRAGRGDPDGKDSYSLWKAGNSNDVGGVNMNFGRSDGSVGRYDDVLWELNPAWSFSPSYEDRMVALPEYFSGAAAEQPTQYLVVPKN